MCGIFAILQSNEEPASLRLRALRLSKRLRHRGPDWNGIAIHTSIKSGEHHALAHERLAIVDLDNGAQPLHDVNKTICLCVNGEIYNHKLLRKQTIDTYKYTTGSDCETIIPLYKQFKYSCVDMLDGMFAFVLLDTIDGSFLAARDALGVCPLYIGWHYSGSLYFSSEMKALDECSLVQEFPAGHYYSSELSNFIRWYAPVWLDEYYIPVVDYQASYYDSLLKELRQSLEAAVVKRMMSDVPFGVLLSGGLDSSLIAAIAARQLVEESKNSINDNNFRPQKLQTFSVGLENSPDLEWAKKVALFINSKHHNFVFTIQEGIDALEEVIAHIETYDVTTVRASTPMFLMARRIKATGVKMVLSGEGSDELFGGYLYFHKAPNAIEFQRELVRKLLSLSKYDCLRANKATAAWGLEVRVPFLDKSFMDVAMKVSAELKMVNEKRKIEKHILRESFDLKGKSQEKVSNQENGINGSPAEPSFCNNQEAYLPDEVLWRQKEQFSDGVGYSWIDALKDHANKTVTDKQMAMASRIYAYNTPTTKEAYLYRSIFESLFCSESQCRTVPSGASIACSTSAALAWDSSWSSASADPSGRAVLGVHADAIKSNS